MFEGFSPNKYGRRRFPFRPGDTVRVKSGPLAGAVGTIERLAGRELCVLVINGLENGVKVVLDAAALELADPLSC